MVISFLYPVQNKPVVDRIAARKATAFAMDMVPRISRAQVFDALRYARKWRRIRDIIDKV
jgi:NAD(P) transhydrogenase